jgi:hypothetical protein
MLTGRELGRVRFRIIYNSAIAVDASIWKPYMTGTSIFQTLSSFIVTHF